MLKEIFRYIRKLKSPEASLVVILLLAAVITVFSLYTKSSNTYVNSLERANVQWEKKYDSLQRADKKELDACQDSKFAEKLDKIVQLEKEARFRDSIINNLQNIK